jgi:rubrerythrin
MTLYPKNWTTEAITKYITQEAQEKDREAFEKTHVPINRIRVEENKAVDTWVDEDERFVDETIVRDTILKSGFDQGNQLFFVVGESGSGKSELCQWLDYEIQDEADDMGDEFAHEPILIPRHVREPRAVLELLTKNLDGWDFEDARYLANLPDAGIFRSVTGNILNQFDRRQEATVDFLSDEVFEDEVKQNLREYVDSFDDPDESIEFEPVSMDELKSMLEGFPRVTHDHEDHGIDPVEYLYREIKSAATSAIEEMLFDGDITEVLHDIDAAYRERNRRPVLIIEDLTGFTIYDHQVLSFFSDLGAAHFDVVVGVTTGVHRRLIDQRRADVSSEDTINDRTMARFKLTEEEEDGAGSRTLFLEQEDVHIDLARKYLTAIKSESAADYDPPLPDGVKSNDVEAAFGEGLYPFNEQFLTRIYENLKEDNVRKQTPRVYLTFVIEELLNSTTPPFEHAEKLQQRLGVVENLISTEYNGADEPVLKWYGERSGKNQIVDDRIPEVFGIDSTGQAPILQDPFDICPECNTGIYEDTDDWTCPNCGHEADSGGRGREGETPREIFDEQKNELLSWRRGETDFNQTSNIERGAERVVRYFHETPDSLVRPECFSSDAAYIRWEKGSTRVPVHVDNGDEPDFTQVTLTPDLEEGLLRDLLRIGVWDEIPLSGHDSQGNVDLERLRAWADDAVDTLRSDLESEVKETFGADIDEIAVFGKYLLNVFTGTSTELTPKALATPVDEEDIIPAFSLTDFEGNLGKLEDKAEHLRGLFHARFHFRRNVVDTDRLETVLEGVDPESLLLRISSIDPGMRGLKIGPRATDSTQFTDFLTSPASLNLRGFACDIDEYRAIYGGDLGSLRNEYETLYQQSHGIENGVELDGLPEAYTHLPRQQPSELDEVEGISTDTLTILMSEVETLVDSLQQCNSVWDYFVARRAAHWIRYNGPHSDTFSIVNEFVDELDNLETDLDRRIEELEAESFEPDTTDFESAQSEASDLREDLGESL